MKETERNLRYVQAGAAATIFLYIVAVIALGFLDFIIVEADKRVEHTNDVQQQISEVLRKYSATDLAMRELIMYQVNLNGDFAEVERSINDQANGVLDALEAVRALTLDNERQQANISRTSVALKARFQILKSYAEQSKARGYAETAVLMRNGNVTLSDRIVKSEIDHLQIEEQSLLQERWQKSQTSRNWTRRAAFGIVMFFGVTLIGFIFVAIRAMKRKLTAAANLRSQLGKLDSSTGQVIFDASELERQVFDFLEK